VILRYYSCKPDKISLCVGFEGALVHVLCDGALALKLCDACVGVVMCMNCGDSVAQIELVNFQ
jgi:hypothetical protein